MVVNGELVLVCHTFLRDYTDKFRVEPLRNFPIERDLIVDMDDFFGKLTSVKSWIIAEEERGVDDDKNVQTPSELAIF